MNDKFERCFSEKDLLKDKISEYHFEKIHLPAKLSSNNLGCSTAECNYIFFIIFKYVFSIWSFSY